MARYMNETPVAYVPKIVCGKCKKSISDVVRLSDGKSRWLRARCHGKEARVNFMATAIRSALILELSQAAYDEIEEKLLEAGYDHLFWRGPGSAIDMSAISVVRAERLSVTEIVNGALEMMGKPIPPSSLEMAIGRISRMQTEMGQFVYCFMCDEMVDKRCNRENCLHAANERVRTDLGLDKHP